MGDNFQALLLKINEFKQKFYLNKLLRGLIFTSAILLALFLILFVFIYFFKPTVALKTIIFLFFIGVSLLTTTKLILIPFLSLLSIGKTISSEEAAVFIGTHFIAIKDKLINTLQLNALAQTTSGNNAIIMAGIDQKIAELKPIPFTSAINIGDNKKYFKYVLIPLSIIFLIGFLAPKVLKEGSYSFLKFNKEILPTAPFQFNLNSNLKITQGDDLTLKLQLTGDEFPQDIYVEDGPNSFKLEKIDVSNFSYTFTNIQKSKKIRFSGGGFTSSTYEINVEQKPSILHIKASLKFPEYIKKPNQEVNPAGDLLIPEGTNISWEFTAENTKNIEFTLGNSTKLINVNKNNSVYTAQIKDPTFYKLTAQNGEIKSKDSISYTIQVVKDESPSIQVKVIQDSLTSKALYFSGLISDDYGFSGLTFIYEILKEGKVVKTNKTPIKIPNNANDLSWFYLWKLNESAIQPGDFVNYYFEVADNDGINGAKKTKSEIFQLNTPTASQITEKVNLDSEMLQKQLQDAIKLANVVEKESKKIAEKLIDKKQLSFEDRKQIEALLNKQKQLENTINDLKSINEKNTLQKIDNDLLNKELLEKQQQINHLLNNVLDDKTKALLKQLEELVKQNNKEQTQSDLSKMQMDNKSIKKELDRILELYKQLDFEQRLQNNIDRLDELAKKQEELLKKTNDNTKNPLDLAKEQESINLDFKELKDELAELNKKNNELERPNQFSTHEEETQSIENQQQKSKENLNNNKRKNAAENQQKSAAEMKALAKKMEEMQNEGEEAENNINIEDLRKLLSKLLSTSFEQEKTMLALRQILPSDPQYVINVQKQRSIKDNMQTMADSLYNLSRRIPQIETTVNTEMNIINTNIEKSIENLGERKTSEANRNQQFTMTSINNLALMLNEALNQLQNSGQGGGSSKKGMKQLQEMQDQLNKNIENAKKELEKNGNQGSVPKSMSEQFAQMAKQQQLIREALQKINREDNKDGKGALGDLDKAIKEMKLTENELVNKRIIDETSKRQKDILTRLLDAEKAEREQDEDAKRTANAAKEFPPSYQKALEKFQREYQSETELLRKLPLNLNDFYKNKISEYYKNLNTTKQP